ncbi:MAG: TPM domain-containing protein [Bacteroidales bacterium]|nr:TPM domain-containing protein [Bacteroidales bacterium]
MGKSASDFFSKQEKEEIRDAIMNAELDTSGEIRVHIENSCSGDVMDRAALVFKQLGMNKTAMRNGVLIYLAIKNRRFAILGDKGIHAVVPENFWDEIKSDMLEKFRNDHFTEGLVKAIESAGEHLKKHFPRIKEDINELSDDISFGKD